MTCSTLTNEELIAALKLLVVREREAIADVVEHLAEVDARRLYIPAACSSLTTYCIEILGYSQFAAAHRVTAARLVREYPVALPMLRSGDLNLSTLRTLAPVLTASNHRERLEAAVGRTRNELERMVAGWAPKPDLPTRIVPVKVEERAVLLERMEAVMTAAGPRPSQNTDAAESLPVPPAVPALAPTPTPTPPPPSPTPRPAPLPKPLTPERYSVQITVDRETYEDLMRVRDHLRHAIPDGDVAKIVSRAVKELRASVEARKFGKRKVDTTKVAKTVAEGPTAGKPTTVEPTTAKPRTVEPETAEPTTAKPTTVEPTTVEPETAKPTTEEPISDVRHSTSDVRHPSSDVRYPPSAARRPPAATTQAELFVQPLIDEGETMSRTPGRATRREVAERDCYQCCYVSDDGHRCSSTAWIEYDHRLEWANNGPTWPVNIQLLCRSHNQAKQRDRATLQPHSQL